MYSTSSRFYETDPYMFLNRRILPAELKDRPQPMSYAAVDTGTHSNSTHDYRSGRDIHVTLSIPFVMEIFYLSFH